MKLIKVVGGSKCVVTFRQDVYIVEVQEPGHVGNDLYRYDVTGLTRQQVIDDYLAQGFISEAEYESAS